VLWVVLYVVICICWKFHAISISENFEKWLRFDKVRADYKVARFYVDLVYSSQGTILDVYGISAHGECCS